MWRSVQLLVVLTWVGSTALLVQKSYFPDLGQFPRVENSRVADLYFEKGQTTDLLLVMERKGAIGRLTVTPRRHSARLAGAGLKKATGEVFFTGRFDPSGLPIAAAGEVVWNGSIFLNRDLGAEGLSLQVRLPKMNLMGQMAVEGAPGRLSYQLKHGREILADSRDEQRNREMLGQLSRAGKIAGVQIPGEETLRELPSLFQGLMPQIVCRHGQFSILGRRYDGYVVNLKWSPDVQANLLITELGELLRLEGVPKVEILAESFVPEEMMEPEDEDEP